MLESTVLMSRLQAGPVCQNALTAEVPDVSAWLGTAIELNAVN